MGIKGICRFLTHRLFEAFIVVLLILFLPHLPPYSNFSESFKVVPTKPLEGRLALNDKLNDVEIWHKGDIIGPEAFADYNGELYASLLGGDIVKLTGNHITPVVKTGKPCKGHHEERICGRPLGLQFDKNGVLYVADAYYGIFKVDVKSGEKTLIVSIDQEIDGKKPKLPNSIALTSNGDIFWTDSSTEFSLENGVFDVLADPSGRLIHYDAMTKQNKVLISKLHFANGVALSENEEFIIVAETNRNRLHRYYLKGPKKGTTDIFIEGLPGMPDNLKSDGNGGFFVPLIIAVDREHPQAAQVIGPFPLLRKFAARVMGLSELVFETLNKVYPCTFAQQAIHFIGHFSSYGSLFTPDRVTVLHLDKNGEILDSLHGTNKKISLICEAHLFKDTLYLGSPFNDYIGKVSLSKIGWEHLAPARQKRELPREQVKPKPTQVPTTTSIPTATTSRPTTTTPRPTTTTTTPRSTTTTTPQPSTTTTTRPATTTTTPRPSTTTVPPINKQTRPPPQQTAPPVKQPPRPSPTPKSATKQSAPPTAHPVESESKPVPVKEPKTRTT